MLTVCFRFITVAQPAPLAACSRLIRWRSTRTCFFDRRQLGHLFRKCVAHLGEFLDRGTYLGEQADAVVFLRPTGKGMVDQVAGQAHTTGHDNVVVRSGGPHPFSRLFQQGGKLHGRQVGREYRGRVGRNSDRKNRCLGEQNLRSGGNLPCGWQGCKRVGGRIGPKICSRDLKPGQNRSREKSGQDLVFSRT